MKKIVGKKTFITKEWRNNDNEKEKGHGPLYDIVKDILKACGWQEYQNSDDEKPELVVLISASKKVKYLSMTDAAGFRNVLACDKRRVLFVGLWKQSEYDLGCFQSEYFWFFQFNIAEAETLIEPLEKWIKQEPEKSKCVLQHEKLKEIIDTTVAYSGFEELYQAVKKDINNLAYRLDVFVALYEMSEKYDTLEHNFKRENKERSNKYEIIKKALEDHVTFYEISKKALDDHVTSYEIIKKALDDHVTSYEIIKKALDDYLAPYEIIKKALDDYVDIWQSICFSSQNTLAGEKILLIDDKPEKYKKESKKYLKIFFGKKVELDCWNPPENGLSIHGLAGYRSDNFFKIQKEEFKDYLKSFSVILVDLLMPDQHGDLRILGIDVIKGLLRVVTDIELDTIPAIIAISRADDSEKVQAALRAGADNYVQKSRLFSLPAVLARVTGSTRIPSTYARRNFRSLYSLPEEIIRLLQTVKVPQIPFDRDYSGEENNKKKKDREKKVEIAQPIARLLQKIPKADLHVHVGSCMSPEFLVAASLVMLLRHDKLGEISYPLRDYIAFWKSKKPFVFNEFIRLTDKDSPEPFIYKNFENGITDVAREVKGYLVCQIRTYFKNVAPGKGKKGTEQNVFREFRAILHAGLKLLDHWGKERLLTELKAKFDIELLLFLLEYGHVENRKPKKCKKDDIIRLYILYQATTYKECQAFVIIKEKKIDFLSWFSDGKIDAANWDKLHKLFYGNDNKKNSCSLNVEAFRKRNWKISDDVCKNLVKFDIALTTSKNKKLLSDPPKFEDDPISYLLTTGTRCTNLKEYLEGCEFSGAEYLRHPFLIHLYAQQTVHQFVQHGLLYAELRAAVSGYENIGNGFTFQDACACLQAAFSHAQKVLLKLQEDENSNEPWFWENQFVLDKTNRNQFPVKVSIILTGKRHKPIRQMIREISAGVVFQNQMQSKMKTVQNFIAKDIETCHFVGFDLAGPEDEFPPELFRTEFGQLAKMHIPITVHSGENAPAKFVENAILELGAKRLGHGLSLSEDRALMNRVREDRVCIELCPVSNFQTNQLVPAGSETGGREYPLREFLENGNAICLNTDNPLISHTNMIKECFHASYAYGKRGDDQDRGLSLWQLLRILRIGFIHSFLHVHDRRAMLELADQILFDMFLDLGVVECMREMIKIPTRK